MLRAIAPLLALALVAVAHAQESPPASPAQLCETYAGHPWEPGQGGIGVPWGKVATGPAVEACRAALAGDPASPEAMFRLARSLIQDQLYDEGLPLLLAAATAGYPPAEAAYGTAYITAQGVNPDYAIAREWLEKAAAHDHPIARNNLGTMLSYGLGAPPDPDGAIALYLAAAEAGYPLAMHNLGVAYTRQGSDENLALALDWFTRATEAGLVASADMVGRAYELGRGTEASDEAALPWYRRGADAGGAAAQTHLALFYIEGRAGLAVDKPAAIDWLRQAAAQRHPPGMRHLGIQLLLAGGASEAIEGMDWLEQAGALGDVEAYAELADYLASTGDLPRATELAQLVVEHGTEAQRLRAEQTIAVLTGTDPATELASRYLPTPTVKPASIPVQAPARPTSQIAGR